MKILKILTIVFITFFLASFGYFKKDAIACELIEVSHFNEVSPNLYVDQSIDSLKLVELSNAVQRLLKGFRISMALQLPTLESLLQPRQTMQSSDLTPQVCKILVYLENVYSSVPKD